MKKIYLSFFALLACVMLSFGQIQGFSGAIENSEIEVEQKKIDVWDLGAEQLDTSVYNNMLTVDIINAFYDPSIAVGSSENTFPSFTSGILSWNGGAYDRLYTSNESLTKFASSLSGTVAAAGYTGLIFVYATADPSKYFSIALNEDDEVTVAAIAYAQGLINFQNEANPEAQTDSYVLPQTVSEFKFVAKTSGTYRIFDSAGTPEYMRILRKSPVYSTISGSVDLTEAEGIPASFKLVFTNEAGKEWIASVQNGEYDIQLPKGYNYNVTLQDAEGYNISQGDILTSDEDAETHNVTVFKLELFTVSGSIQGLGAFFPNLTLAFSPSPESNSTFIPVPVLNPDSSYTIDIEPYVEYTITEAGVNDFIFVNPSLKIGNNDTTVNLVFQRKARQNITINTEGLDNEQQAALMLTFTNLSEEGYAYTFNLSDDILLRDAGYAISYSGLSLYPIELDRTSNLVVAGEALTKNLVFSPVNNWPFNDQEISNETTAYKGLQLAGSISNEIAKGHLVAQPGASIQIPVKKGEKVSIKYYYSADFTIDGGDPITTSSQSTSIIEKTDYVYTGDEDAYITVTFGAGASTSYITNISKGMLVPYTSTLEVGADKEYKSINAALNAVRNMIREDDARVTIFIDPGNYEEMLVIDEANITFKNAASNPDIDLKNKGVDIGDGAVRITSYYGHGYNYYSMDNQKWDADVLRVNKENGYVSYKNVGAGTTNGSYWNASVVVFADGFEADWIIFENSFNQYISRKESEDVVEMWETGSRGLRPTEYGATDVQQKSFVERATAIAYVGGDKSILNMCRLVGRQDVLYGGPGSRVVANKGVLMGAVDYIYGALTLVCYKTDLAMNTGDGGGDASLLTAAQQAEGRGYLMYKCRVTSAKPGTESASQYLSKPGLFGRPWKSHTSEVVFYNTTVDSTNHPDYKGMSLISPDGWSNSLGGESAKMYEFGTIEKSGEDNLDARVDWATLLTEPMLTDGTEITTFNFTKGTDDWDPLPVETDFLELSIESLSVDQPEGSATFTINSNVGWLVSCNKDWLTINKTSGFDNSEITIMVSENNTGVAREATIVVAGNGLEDKAVVVTQGTGGNGINESVQNTFSVYPNPSKGTITIQRKESKKAELTIINAAGQIVLKKTLFSIEETVNLDSIDSGVYFVNMNGQQVKLLVNR